MNDRTPPSPPPPVLDYETPEKPKQYSGYAIASLVCGFFSFVPLIPPMLAVSWGSEALKEIKEKGYAGENLAQTGKALGIFGLMWSALLVGVFVLFYFLPTLGHPRFIPNRNACAANLKQIGTAMLQYANANNNQFPPDLQTLILTEKLFPKILICRASIDTPLELGNKAIIDPSLEWEGHLSYVYIHPQATMDKVDPRTVVVYEHLQHHDNDGINILFGDLHVEYLRRMDAKRMIPALQAERDPYSRTVPATQPTTAPATAP